uniref:sphinganine-1-phosphate aldolase n=1 Tax=Timema poppense TaxID=170557 RepID=A0A7R9D8W5_TIMPO|nr:unnamed protein product [Timema poppensis]
MTGSLFKPGFEHFKIFVNGCLCDKEPWQIVTLTTTSVLAGVWLWGFIFQEESLLSRGKKTAFRLARKIPAIARRIDSELDKINETFEKEVINRNQGNPYITTLPDKGKSHAEIVELVKQYLKFGDYKWEEGYVSGAVYYFNTDLIKLLTDVYTLASYTNPLHPDIFPGVCKMEAEVVRMTANLFHGGPSSCGTMTTGGTESILMACKAYRDYARSEWGIKHPEIILPTTSHPAFDKAGLYFGIRITHTPVDPVHYRADINAMRRAIGRNTILLVGSTPNFPYGTMDDIEEIAALGRQYNIPVHVDACLGGFLVVFMEQAGYKLPPFDFSVPGVTSISADTHKYGFAPKGSSVILYSEPKYRHHQFCVTTDWPGGVYGSPTVNGSRAGGKLNNSFCNIQSIIRYTSQKLIHSARDVRHGRTNHPISVRMRCRARSEQTAPLSVLARLCSKLVGQSLVSSRPGFPWVQPNLDQATQIPGYTTWGEIRIEIHLCVTYMHTMNGVADRFIADVEEEVALIMKDPGKEVDGKLAMYGMAQKIPDRSIVGDFTRFFLDSMYYTPANQ